MTKTSWLITAPSIGLILLFMAWSGYWYFLKEKTVIEIEKSLTQLKTTGVSLSCSEKKYGGYPFRLQFDCSRPIIQIKKHNLDAQIKAAHLRILTQAYKLRHLIAEQYGTLEFHITQHSKTDTIPATQTSGSLESDNLRASLVFDKIENLTEGVKNIDSISIIADQLKIQGLQTKAWGQKIPLTMSAAKSGLHIRDPRRPGTKGVDSDVAIEAIDLNISGNFYSPLDGNQFTAKRIVLNALIRPFYPALIGTSSLAKNWYEMGGAAEIDALYVEREDVTLRGEGILSLDKNGQLGGSMDVKFLGFESILNKLIAQKVLSKNQAVLANTGLELLSKSTAEEQKQKILTIPMNFTNGQVYFGPHSLGFSPSFF